MGGVVTAAVDLRGALLINAATFGASALLPWRGVRPRPAAMAVAEHRSPLRETGDGWKLVFGHRVSRGVPVSGPRGWPRTGSPCSSTPTSPDVVTASTGCGRKHGTRTCRTCRHRSVSFIRTLGLSHRIPETSSRRTFNPSRPAAMDVLPELPSVESLGRP